MRDARFAVLARARKPDIFPDIYAEMAVSNTSQKRALKNYRKRLSSRGIARFEVLGLDADRELIRALAKRLAESGPEANRIRTTVSQTLAAEQPARGGILAALRRSPLANANLKIKREITQGRRIEGL